MLSIQLLHHQTSPPGRWSATYDAPGGTLTEHTMLFKGKNNI